jgi:YkoY family integral membrane protein
MLINQTGPLMAMLTFSGGQTVEAKDLVTVALLILLEGVLSIDNALVLGLLAKRLPPSQRARALSYGLIGAFVFRFIAIGTATFLLQWTTAKFLGGAYLVYIAVKHLLFEAREGEPEELIVMEEGELQLVDSETGEALPREREEQEIQQRTPFDVAALERATAPVATEKLNMRHFWWTVFVIEMTDIAFAVDSIVAALGVVGGPPPGTPAGAIHPKLWVVILGGFLGVVVMRFAAAMFVGLLTRFPRFETAAYLLVIVIGLKLLADWGLNSDFATWGWTANQRWAESYVHWLQQYWPLELSPKSLEHPHLLDFHDLRRPECLLFWILMLSMFCVGFIPRREPAKGSSHKRGPQGIAH